MNCYEKLIDECYKENVTVVEKNFKSKAKGLWKNKKIGISARLTTIKEKNCVLAEEYGHYKTTLGNITNLNDIGNVKQEIQARRWGYEKMCSLEKIIEAVKAGSKDKYEIADYLNVTDDFFDKAIKYHRLKHGINCICQGVFIYFEPTFGILENR